MDMTKWSILRNGSDDVADWLNAQYFGTVAKLILDL